MKISMLLTLFPLLMPASVLAGTAQYTDLGAVMALTLTKILLHSETEFRHDEYFPERRLC